MDQSAIIELAVKAATEAALAAVNANKQSQVATSTLVVEADVSEVSFMDQLVCEDGTKLSKVEEEITTSLVVETVAVDTDEVDLDATVEPEGLTGLVEAESVVTVVADTTSEHTTVSADQLAYTADEIAQIVQRTNNRRNKGKSKGGHGDKQHAPRKAEWQPRMHNDDACRAALLFAIRQLQSCPGDRLMVFYKQLSDTITANGRHGDKRHRRGASVNRTNSLFIVVRKKGKDIKYVTRSVWNDDERIIIPDVEESHWYNLAPVGKETICLKIGQEVTDHIVLPPYQYLTIENQTYMASVDDEVKMESNHTAQLMGSDVSVTKQLLADTIFASRLEMQPIIDFRCRAEVRGDIYQELSYRMSKAIDKNVPASQVEEASFSQTGEILMVTVYAGELDSAVDLGAIKIRFND